MAADDALPPMIQVTLERLDLVRLLRQSQAVYLELAWLEGQRIARLVEQVNPHLDETFAALNAAKEAIDARRRHDA